MSRIIQQIATVQFQVDNRKVTASMNALQTEAESLNGKIAAVKQSIKDLGDVPADNKFLLEYQKQLRQLNSDLKDVTTAQRDLMKGVKAADQLWKAAATQDIESLSIKAIKAGQNGLRKRMENLRPELGGDEQKMYDAYKAVIDEADRVMNVFKSNYATVVQTIRDGGIVSEQVMKSTRDALRDLMEAEKEGTAEHRQLAQQYDFLNESLTNVAEMRRREKGEIVNANDARREALKLTEDGIAAARRERDMADTVIAGMQQQKSDLDQLRRFHEDRIAQTEREIAANQRLEEAEQDRLADVEKAMRYTENEDRKEASRLRKKADAAAEQAELLDAIARRDEAVGESQAKIDRSRQRANEKLAEYISLNREAEQMEEKVAHQEEEHAKAMDHQSERLREIRAEGQRLLDQYDLQKKEMQAVDKAWADADVKQGEAEARKAQNQELTIKSLDDSIRKLKEANAVIDTNSDEWEENTRIIQRLQAALDEMKNKPALMMMTDRMQDVSKLSTAAVTETRKFWETMVAGAERGSKELAEYEGHLKTITEEEQKRSRESLRKTARSILTNQENMTEEELRRGIAAAKEYMQQFSIGGKVREKYNEAILRGTELLKKNSAETIQAKQKEQELNAAMKQRMERLPRLSAAALEETKKYWQAQLTGAERGSEAYKEIEARIKAVTAEQQKMAHEQLKQTAKGVFGVYSNMSGNELDNSIKAAKEYLLTLNQEGEAFKKMSAAVLEAEKYQKEHNLETERARQKEQELNAAMTQRMQNLHQLTDGALAETKKYWEAQRDGAQRGSEAFKEAEAHIKAINDQQKQYANEALRRQARNILTNQENMTEEELRRGIAAAKEYMQQFSIGGKVREKYNEAILRGEQLLKRTGIEAKREAQREAEAKAESIRKEQELNAAMTQRMQNLHRLTDGAMAETKKYWETQLAGVERGSKEAAEFERHIKAINDLQDQRRLTDTKNAARRIFRDQTMMTEDELRKAIAAAKEYVQTFKVGGQVREMYNQAIARGEELLKQNSVETERAKQKEQELKQTMTDRLQSLSTLSADSLAEAKKYWEEQYRGAERSTQAFKDAEDAVKRINEQENTRKAGQATRVLAKPENYGDAEIREAIQAMEQLRDAQAHGSAQWEIYNKRVEEGRRYLDEWKQVDSVVKFEGQMAKLPQLSDAALQETKKFWETMVAGAEKGSSELREYEAHLEKVKQEERERRQLNDEITVQRLDGNLKNQSEQEISEAIEAGKRLIKTYETASPEADALAKKIADAEEHLKKYGLEAERTARKEAQAVADAAKKRQESDDLMKQQLQQGASLSKEALKAQEQYWKHLIDDPKTAAASLADYQKQLDQVRYLQELMMQQEGSDALDFFRGGTGNASAEEIKRQADALKLFRNSLPQQDNADLIKEIDQYLEKAGETAKNTAKQMMSIREAYTIGLQVNNGTFRGSTDQLNRAKKTLEELQQRVEKGGRSWQKLQRGIEGINLELKRTETLSDEVQQVLDKPKGRSLNDLRNAVEQARLKLQSMDRTTKDGQKAFDELAKKIRATELELKQMSGEAKATVSAFDKAWSRLKTYVGLYVGASVAMNKLVGTMGDLMDLSDKMGEVRKTTGFTADEVGRLSGELKKMDTRTTLNGLLDLSVAAGQLGLKTEEDVLGFTEAANKLMVALPEMGREGATEMLKVALATGEIDKIRKQMEQGLIEGSSATAVAMEKVGSTIDRLRATSAATAPAITDFVKRVGAVGAQSGITIDQVAALGSTVDALGMRVEMSATALSRMIPAIKNNAFDVAKAIGVTPDTLRNLFDTGRGMEAILMIFQHIKDAGMGEDDIESMLGMGNMKEVMKELNQMGARAGIVFSGLSQNVDELRRQLGVAGEAYEQNIAIQQEYDKMNETTMAKWERLKNQVEEFFVGDDAQRFLGGIIDSLRTIVDLLTGPLTGAVKAAIWSFSVFKAGVGALGWKFLIEPIHDAITGVHSLETSFKRMAVTWRNAWKSMDAATKANWIFAIGTAIYQLGMWAYESYTKVSELDQALARLDNETDDAVRHVGRLVTAFNDSTVKADKAAKKHEELKAQTEALSKEVEKLKKATDGGAESTDVLRKKESELEEKEKELKKATDESNKANDTRLKLISEINSTYSTYLGYMLNEKTAAEEVASAHQLIVAALKEERKQKGLNAIHDAVDKEYAEDIKEYTENSQSELSEISRNAQRRIMDQWRRVLTSVSYDAESDKYTLSSMDGLTKKDITVKSEKEIKDVMKQALREIVRQEATDISGKVNVSTWAGKGIKTVDDYVRDIWGDSMDDGFGDWAETYIKRERDIVQATHDNQVETNQAHQGTVKAAVKNMDENLKSLRKTAKENQDFTDDQIRQMAQNVNAVMAAFEKYGSEISQSNRDATFGKGKDATLANAVNNILANLDQKTRSRVLRVAQKAGKPGTGGNGNGNASTNVENIWGGNAPADSTDYGTWDVNELVARRNQMDKFKNVLKPDTDIRAVLAEDKALMKALDNGLKEDWKSVLGWYNTERKKIQEELKSERFSTNEGHWRDEKQGRGRKNRFRESDYALAELDRYYSKRKEDLEKARIEENMSEELFNRQAELLEQEHLERRSKLRETFTAGSTEQEKKMVKQFREWWDQLEKQGLLDEVPWATVESEWSKALASEIGRNNLRAQQDLTKLQEITVKHLNEIAKLIDKERPYDGITANLRKNLTEMDILLADMQKDGPEKDTAKLVKAETIRLKFLLSEAEQAYSLNFEQLKEKMVKEGFGEWAQAIEGDEQLKQSLMQNLRNTYDAIQEAIKKESSVIKKQLEIQWNDLMPGSDMSMKGTFEKAVSDLGLAGDQVKRANSLIGAGTASDRVADKLAIQQMRIQLQMQETYFALMQKIGHERIKQLEQSAVANEREAKALKEKAELLRKEGKTAEAEVTELKAQNALRQSLQDKFDAEHAAKSLSLARTKELAEEEKQRVAIANQLEETQNRLYTDLKSWGDLLSSSLQSVFEASHTADREYYNERAKLDLTGNGGPGAGTYIVIDNEGTDDARAHYEYLDEREALERQREIENDNAVAEAWKKMLDDLNQKMSDTITDQMNAMLQAESIDKNTQAVIANTEALWAQLGQGGSSDFSDASRLKRNAEGMAVDESGQPIAPIQPTEVEQSGGVTKAPWQMTEDELAKNQENMYGMWQAYKEYGIAAETEKAEALAEIPGYTPSPLAITEEQVETVGEIHDAMAQKEIDASKKKTEAILADQQKIQKSEQQTDQKMAAGAQGAFAKMIAAANLYGIAYQTMSNDNLSATQKFEMMAVQAAGQSAIAMLTTDMATSEGKTAAKMPGILGQCIEAAGPYAGPVLFAVISGVLGGLLGLAVSKIAKSKSTISQATGTSMNAGRLSTGMMTYAEGNVNKFTDPATLTPGRSYNVDAADGRTYRAKYTGTNPKTHITSGPEFHLVGERGQEAIIDAKTTRQIRMDDNGIWQSIQTLYNGGRLSASRRRRAGMGVRAFADGNMDDFEEIVSGTGTGDGAAGGMSAEQMAAFQSSLDRNNELLERALSEGIHARFDVYGKGGLIDSYDTGKKTVSRHGEKF